MFVFFRIGLTNSFNKQSNKTFCTSEILTYFSSDFLFYLIFFLTGNNVCRVVLSSPKLACIILRTLGRAGYKKDGWMCHSITIFDLKTNFFLIIPPKISTIFFSSLNFFFTSYRTLKNQSIIPVVKLMVSVITNKIISNGGIPLILFLFLAISNRCIQKKGINKLIFHKDIYMEGESLTPSLLDKHVLPPSLIEI